MKRVIIIGAGNVATHIAKAMYNTNMKVAQIWSRNHQNAINLAKEVDSVAINELIEIDNDADFCIVAVKDDAIGEVVKDLVDFKGVIAHTSGSIGNDIFIKLNLNCGVFYPLQTFSKAKKVDFKNIPICVEANNERSLKALLNLGKTLSNNVVKINSEKRKILHLAAVFACNFTNHLYALAENILSENDLDFSILSPLITETADKIKFEHPLTVQTGPAYRDDITTLKMQRKLLIDKPDLLNIYNTLSESIKKTR